MVVYGAACPVAPCRRAPSSFLHHRVGSKSTKGIFSLCCAHHFFFIEDLVFACGTLPMFSFSNINLLVC